MKRPFKIGMRLGALALIAVSALLVISLSDCRGRRSEEEPSAAGARPPAALSAAAARRAVPPLPPPHQENALEKIEAAEEAGLLDLDTAWTYRFRALFEPSRLPQEYRSKVDIPCGTPVFSGFAEVRDRLRPETLAGLEPYLVRPTDPRSVFASRLPARTAAGSRAKSRGTGLLFALEAPGGQRPTENKSLGAWVGVGCRTAPVTIWSHAGVEPADRAAAAFDRRNLWHEFKKIMPLEPLSDKDVVDEHGRPDNGHDGDLDIYLVPPLEELGTALGFCATLSPAHQTPTYILILESLTGDDLEAVMAHELFHSFQCALDSNEEIWWEESTATWAEEYIDSDWQTEQQYMPHAFVRSEFRSRWLRSRTGLAPYGAYLFPFYLASRFGDRIVGDIWNDCAAAGPNALQAVIGRIQMNGLSFEEAFKEYALVNYDATDTFPAGRKYPEPLDTFPHHFERRIMLKDRSDSWLFDMNSLSAKYLHVYNDGIDPAKFPAALFDLKNLSHHSFISVQAVIFKGQDHRLEDWTGLEERYFCLTNESDRFDDIVIVMASTEPYNAMMGLLLPIELGYVSECDADWIGTLTFQASYNCRSNEEGEWVKTGAWREGNSGPWQDQFTKHDFEISRSFSANATVNLILKAAPKEAESAEEKEMMEQMSRLFGSVVYVQDTVKGSAQISLREEKTETTTVRPPGRSDYVTSKSNAGGGGALAPYGLSPRLTIHPEKGEYTLEINFSAPDAPGVWTVESSNAPPTSGSWTYDGAKPLFDAYVWRETWHEPVLRGTFKGNTIQGSWKSPPRPCLPEDKCSCLELPHADLTVQWSLRKLR